MSQEIRVRDATPDDADALASILNAIIARGGTTAYQSPFEREAFLAAFLRGERHLLCSVAEATGAGELVGFQHLERHPALPPDWADIATFARLEPKLRGVGRALFRFTCARASAGDVATINATIRADNDEGLHYYAAMGFRRYAIDEAVPLADGTPVDRISMRYDLIG